MPTIKRLTTQLRLNGLTLTDQFRKPKNERRNEAKVTQLNAAERMLKSKRKLIARLRREITQENEERDRQVLAIQARIRIAQTLVDALEKGTLNP